AAREHRRRVPSAVVAPRWGFVFPVLMLTAHPGCKSPAQSLAASDELFCVERRDGSQYCFGDDLANPSPFRLPARMKGARLVLGAGICAETPSEVLCARDWTRPATLGRQPFAEDLEEWVQLPSEMRRRTSSGLGPLRACGR